MSKKILVLGNMVMPAEIEELEEKYALIHAYDGEAVQQAVKEQAGEIEGIISMYDNPVGKTLMAQLPSLKIIAQFAVGFDNVDLEEARARDIAVTNTPDVLTADTADTALALLLSVLRRVVECDQFFRQGTWLKETMPLGTSMSGKKVGIVGLGRIGQAIARRCAAFDMEIAYFGPRKKPDFPYTYYSDLKALADESEILILSCAATEQTQHLITQDILQALGNQGVLINVARGSVVKQDDLLMALQNKVIAGAGLDVYESEPCCPKELISLDNVVLLPHIGSATKETRSSMGRLVIDNLNAFFDGKPLITPV